MKRLQKILPSCARAASPEALENLNHLSGCHQETMAHGDTLNHFLGHVPPEAMHSLCRAMVQRLIRMKALDGGRLFGHFLVVLDGTGQFYFREKHCEHCLTKTVDGKIQYYHHVLEAKLVTPEGLAISFGSDFIENSDPKATKQDCELKAFARLASPLQGRQHARGLAGVSDAAGTVPSEPQEPHDGLGRPTDLRLGG
jgi:hypothetical protein